MAAPGCHVGLRARREAAAAAAVEGGEAESETEEEEEEEPGPEALRSVFPRDPELFADAFPVERRYRLCGRVLRIAQHHGPRLGLAASVWEALFLGEGGTHGAGGSIYGAGLGAGLSPPHLGGDVTITDRPAALDQIRENVRLNFPGGGGARPRVQALVWGQDEGGSVPGGYEVILGSDIVYHPPSFAPLLSTLRRLCGPRAIALLCAKMRGGDGGARRFFRQMLPPYFRVQLLRREPEEEIEIYRCLVAERPAHLRGVTRTSSILLLALLSAMPELIKLQSEMSDWDQE
uniref:EEF1A lysine methyltransferase 3 n=1 Tax=Calidris pygmaea TaxID=425635 RepID=A0A8C3K3I1_9CHAR